MASGLQTVGSLPQETAIISLQESQMLPNLPQDIITEILARLPVECLLRFRCVSRSWHSLISSPLFVDTHMDVSNNNKHESARSGRRLVLIASITGFGRMYSVHSLARENSCLSLFELNHLSTTPCKSPRIMGSCNGLLCLSTANLKLLLWNPSTRKSWDFPDSYAQRNSGCCIRYGFGYDERTKDYKVVKVFSFDQTGGGSHENKVHSYSLRSKSWTVMSGFSSGYIYGSYGVFLNGALHWEIRHTDVSWEIGAMDLSQEMRYRTISLPSSENGKFHLKLEISGGDLVACFTYYPKKMNVWVMKEYGVVESWTKVVSVSLSGDDHRGYVSLLHMSENGEELLLKLGTQLVCYNCRNGSFKKLHGYDYASSIELQSATYCESLALIDNEEESPITEVPSSI